MKRRAHFCRISRFNNGHLSTNPVRHSAISEHNKRQRTWTFPTMINPSVKVELRIRKAPYIAFSVICGIPTVMVIFLLSPQTIISTTGDIIWGYYVLALFIFGTFYIMFLLWWHRHILDGTHWTVQQTEYNVFMPHRHVIPLESITALRKGTGFAGRHYNALFVHYTEKGVKKKFPVVLEAHYPADLTAFLSAFQRMRPDLKIPNLPGIKGPPSRRTDAS